MYTIHLGHAAYLPIAIDQCLHQAKKESLKAAFIAGLAGVISGYALRKIPVIRYPVSIFFYGNAIFSFIFFYYVRKKKVTLTRNCENLFRNHFHRNENVYAISLDFFSFIFLNFFKPNLLEKAIRNERVHPIFISPSDRRSAIEALSKHGISSELSCEIDGTISPKDNEWLDNLWLLHCIANNVPPTDCPKASLIGTAFREMTILKMMSDRYWNLVEGLD